MCLRGFGNRNRNRRVYGWVEMNTNGGMEFGKVFGLPKVLLT